MTLLGRLDHVLELLQRTNLNGGRSWLGICPLHFARLWVTNLSLWQRLLLDTNDFAEVRNNEGTNPLLANSSSDLALQRFENFGNLLLRQASRFGDVRKNLDLSERLFCLACCFRHVRNPFQQISNQKTVRRRTLLMAELKNVPNEMQPGMGENPWKTLYF